MSSRPRDVGSELIERYREATALKDDERARALRKLQARLAAGATPVVRPSSVPAPELPSPRGAWQRWLAAGALVGLIGVGVGVGVGVTKSRLRDAAESARGETHAVAMPVGARTARASAASPAADGGDAPTASAASAASPAADGGDAPAASTARAASPAADSGDAPTASAASAASPAADGGDAPTASAASAASPAADGGDAPTASAATSVAPPAAAARGMDVDRPDQRASGHARPGPRSGAAAASRGRPARQADAAATQAKGAPVDQASAAPAVEATAPAAAAESVATAPAPRRLAERIPERGEAPPMAASLEQETALLERAQAALRRGDAQRALSLLAEHTWRFPTGHLSEARDVARILALCQSGHVTQSREQAARFLATRATSPFAARVRASCPERTNTPGQ
jgi:hypothetical protein